LRTWGEQGIAARGGLLNIAKELKVSYGTLASLISVSGQPTPVGLRKLGEAMIRPVTTEDLEQLWALGSDGVAALGGLPAIADRLGVSYGSLAQLAKPSGEPTEAGLRKLAHAKPKPVTIEILQHLRTLGQGGITRLGGLSAIARHLGVSYATLAQLIKPCGQPTQAGLLKLGETTVRRITVEDLRQLRTEGKDGIERRGGLSAIAVELGVNFNSLKVLIDANGRLTPIGLRKLRQTIAIPVTAAHVSQLRTWGEDGIASRGGLLAIADQFGVSYSTLRAMVDAQGRPTMAGLCKLGEARVRPLTVEDLRQVSALGQDGIKAQGGLSAVADKLQVSFIALRRLITVHGQPTKAGLSRLAAAAAKSASDELPAMRKVNR
jgi:DNA-binding phage protein